MKDLVKEFRVVIRVLRIVSCSAFLTAFIGSMVLVENLRKHPAKDSLAVAFCEAGGSLAMVPGYPMGSKIVERSDFCEDSVRLKPIIDIYATDQCGIFFT